MRGLLHTQVVGELHRIDLRDRLLADVRQPAVLGAQPPPQRESALPGAGHGVQLQQRREGGEPLHPEPPLDVLGRRAALPGLVPAPAELAVVPGHQQPVGAPGSVDVHACDGAGAGQRPAQGELEPLLDGVLRLHPRQQVGLGPVDLGGVDSDLAERRRDELVVVARRRRRIRRTEQRSLLGRHAVQRSSLLGEGEDGRLGLLVVQGVHRGLHVLRRRMALGREHDEVLEALGAQLSLQPAHLLQLGEAQQAVHVHDGLQQAHQQDQLVLGELSRAHRTTRSWAISRSMRPGPSPATSALAKRWPPWTSTPGVQPSSARW